jgi:uncharacterized protein (TIGR02266 family)
VSASSRFASSVKSPAGSVEAAGVHESRPVEADCDSAALVREFLPLNRRRIRGEALTVSELERWSELRDRLEELLGCAPTGSGQRRRALRVRTHLKLLVTTSVAQELLHAHDLCEGGLFVRTQRPSPPGTPLQLELQDRAGRSVELEGTVAWVRNEPDGLGPAGMGIAFHALSEWDRALLADLVEAALEAL